MDKKIKQQKQELWRKYYAEIYLLLRGVVTPWEYEFLSSVRSQLWRITPKQIATLEKISKKYLK